MGQSLPVWLRGHSPSQTQAQLERLHRGLENTYYEVESQALYALSFITLLLTTFTPWKYLISTCVAASRALPNCCCVF